LSKHAFLFPGQGAQSVGMGQQLAESLPAARELFRRANDVLGYDLAELCFSGPADVLNTTDHSQPALFVASLAALESMKAESADLVDACSVAAGLSLGEYTAMVFAGVMDFETGLAVVQQRGEAMQQAAESVASGMVSVLGLERQQVEELVSEARGEDTLEIANLLCPGNIVISGSQAACDRAAQLAVEKGAMKAIALTVAGAFHTDIMGPAVERLTAALAEAKLSAPRIPVVSNVDAKSHADPEEIRDLLIRQVVSPVLWEDSMRTLLADGCEQFYEIGPGRVLRGLLRRIGRKIPCENITA